MRMQRSREQEEGKKMSAGKANKGEKREGRSGVLMVVASSCQAERESKRDRDSETEEGGWGAERAQILP
jgi:hypothetical protein